MITGSAFYQDYDDEYPCAVPFADWGYVSITGSASYPAHHQPHGISDSDILGYLECEYCRTPHEVGDFSCEKCGAPLRHNRRK